MKHKITIDGDTIETDDKELAKEFIRKDKLNEKIKTIPYHLPIIIEETEAQRKIRETPLFQPIHLVDYTNLPIC